MMTRAAVALSPFLSSLTDKYFSNNCKSTAIICRVERLRISDSYTCVYIDICIPCDGAFNLIKSVFTFYRRGTRASPFHPILTGDDEKQLRTKRRNVYGTYSMRAHTHLPHTCPCRRANSSTWSLDRGARFESKVTSSRSSPPVTVVHASHLSVLAPEVITSPSRESYIDNTTLISRDARRRREIEG